MKKSLLIIGLASVLSASCVSLSEVERKDAELEQKSKEYNLTRQELFELKEESTNLARQNQNLTNEMAEMVAERDRQNATIDSLTRLVEGMQQRYDTTMENYAQELTGKTRDLNRAQNMLTARTKELNDKEAAFKQKEAAFRQNEALFESKQAELLERQSKLEKQEAATRAQLEAKERELENLRTSVTRALTGFADKGLKVETKDGKVYVSMENKLLFPSASWTVSKEGINAIKELAKVLEADSTLNIMVEGHTDNDAYRGSTAVKDNWDLSVMRATAIVKLLLQNGPGIDPARIEACGHGEFAPKVANDSPEHKAINRRTEIILTPRLTEIMKIVE
ncbi:MAG: OmpA family protein [Bacteroidales bacterium]|nr:OmpA family protein [Bacteroidales bacterium]